MDPNSGKIIPNLTDEEARKHGLVPIPPEELPRVQGMNRHQRRAWAAQQKRAKGAK